MLFKQLKSHVTTRYKAHLYTQIKLTNMTILINVLHNKQSKKTKKCKQNIFKRVRLLYFQPSKFSK